MSKNLAWLSLLLILVFGGALALIYQSTNPKGPKSVTTLQTIPSRQAGPSIRISPEAYDFGEVIYGQVARQTFQVSNVGNQALEIQRLSTSCGCTQAFMAESDKIIAPGQAVELVVTFDPAVHKDDTDIGELTRVVYVRSNDPNQSEVEINLKANVIKP